MRAWTCKYPRGKDVAWQKELNMNKLNVITGSNTTHTISKSSTVCQMKMRRNQCNGNMGWWIITTTKTLLGLHTPRKPSEILKQLSIQIKKPLWNIDVEELSCQSNKGTKSIKNEHPIVLIAWFSVTIGPEQFMLWSLSTSESMDINSQGHSYSRFLNYPLWSCSNLWKDRKNLSVVPYVKIQNLTTTETKTVTSYLKEIFKSTTPSSSIMEETLFNDNARFFSTRFHSQKVWIPSRSQKVLNGLVKFHLRTDGWPC